MGHNYGYRTYNPLITTHEPPSMGLWETAFGFLGSALRSGSGGPGKSGQQQTAAQVDIGTYISLGFRVFLRDL